MYGISNSQQQGGGGGGAASITYAKLSGDVEFSSTRPSASSAFFVNTNAATWAENEMLEQKALARESDLGLVIGNSYTLTANIDGTSTEFSGTAVDGASYDLLGSTMVFLVNASGDSQFIIYDHCNFSTGMPTADNGAVILASLSSKPTSATITNFSGTLQIVSPVTITDTAIKTNSSVTMYINSSLVVRGTKTDGSITLTASTEGSLSYEMEILDVPTEGLFEIVNGYIPEIPDTPSGVPQWNTIYEDTAGTGAVSVELSEPLQAGGLYRVTFGGSVYMFCSPNTGRESYTGSFAISTELFQNATTMCHLTYNFTHRNTSLSLDYLAQYTITADGVSNISFANNSTIQALKITKVEVYR